MKKVIAVVSQKGGAGKTPTAVHLGYGLARAGKKVLFVDADAQASASLHFIGVGYMDITETLYNGILTLTPIAPIIISENLHLLSAHDELSNAEVELPKSSTFYQPQLQRLLWKYKGYDYIIIDTPGSNISIFTTLALTAATHAIIPVKTEFSAERAMVDTMSLIKDIQGDDDNPRRLNAQLKIWGILPTQFEGNVTHHKDVFEALKDQYHDLVYAEPSRKTNKYNTATALRCDIRDLDVSLGRYWDRVATELERAS